MIVFGILLPIVETATSGTLMETQIADLVFFTIYIISLNEMIRLNFFIFPQIFEVILFVVSLMWFLYVIIDVYVYLWKRNRCVDKYAYKENYTHDNNSKNGGLYVRIGAGCKIKFFLLFFSH